MLETQNLELTKNGHRILSLSELSVKKNKHLLILGPSGCGKTSLMNILAGLLKPTKGSIAFEGQPYESLSDQTLDRLRAENFGFIFQKLHLLGHLSVTQNIALAQLKSDPGHIQNLINSLGLSDKEHQKARDLSVGEAQRVAIARAVVHSPKVIFADEPTSALDDTTTQKVMDLLFAQADKTGATVITATHDERIKGCFTDVLEMDA